MKLPSPPKADWVLFYPKCGRVHRMEHETFWTLFTDLAHWQFEFFLIFLTDVLVGMIIWPQLKRWFKHHKEDDNKLAELEGRLAKLEQGNNH
jgi:hypothetical protein